MLEYSDKIDLNARSKDGGTAVMTACINGHKYVVKFKIGKTGSLGKPTKIGPKVLGFFIFEKLIKCAFNFGFGFGSYL